MPMDPEKALAEAEPYISCEATAALAKTVAESDRIPSLEKAAADGERHRGMSAVLETHYSQAYQDAINPKTDTPAWIVRATKWQSIAYYAIVIAAVLGMLLFYIVYILPKPAPTVRYLPVASPINSQFWDHHASIPVDQGNVTVILTNGGGYDISWLSFDARTQTSMMKTIRAASPFHEPMIVVIPGGFQVSVHDMSFNNPGAIDSAPGSYFKPSLAAINQYAADNHLVGGQTYLFNPAYGGLVKLSA